MDQKTKEIQLSISYNNASRIVAGAISNSNVNKNHSFTKLVDAVDELARQLYAKQIKFLEEINEQNHKV